MKTDLTKHISFPDNLLVKYQEGDMTGFETGMCELPQVDCPVIHHFGPGIYIREVHMPAGIIALGHVQRYAQQNIFIKGRVMMLTEDGSMQDLQAPAIFMGKPGRKVGYIMEDMVWQNVYASNSRDVHTLETQFLDHGEGWHGRRLCEQEDKHKYHAHDRADYLCLLKERGITPEIAQAETNITHDLIELPCGSYKFKVDLSPIQGHGLFCTFPIRNGEVIAPASLDGCRTPAGRYANHSMKPNAKFEKSANGDLYLVATSPIYGCQGGFNGDEITINYRQALALSGRYYKEVE